MSRGRKKMLDGCEEVFYNHGCETETYALAQ